MQKTAPKKSIVIIGNGISGITTARHIRKYSENQITVVSEEHPYFFSRTALMYVYMGHMKFEDTEPYEKHFWTKNKINLIQSRVEEIETNKKNLKLSNGQILKYDSLIIATGSKPNKFGWKGQDAKGVMGLYHKQDLENLEHYAPNNQMCKRAVIVGGGLIGIELAEMLHSRHIPVTFLVRETSFWNGVLPQGESEIINREILEKGIDLRLKTHLKEIVTDENGRVQGVKIQDTEEEIPCNVVGLTAGVAPNIAFLDGSGIETNRGVLVNSFLETNLPDVYAVGDCAEQRVSIGKRKAIEAVWYTGRMMGETVAQTICGNRKEYKPGFWFNSAKFFDIEYQTYGWIGTQAEPNETRFYWEHSNGKKCLHFSFDKKSKVFLGVNALGIRLRHEFFNRVMEQKKTIYYVLEHFKEALFDPEFYPSHEREVIIQFNQEQNTELSIKKKPWFKFFSNTTPGS